MTGVGVGEPDTDRWQPVDTGHQDEAEVAPPAAEEVAPPTPAATRSATPTPTPAPATDSTGTSATVTPAGQMLIGATSVATLGGIGLYNTVGVAGLAVGGATAVASVGGYAYWRYQRRRSARSSRNGGGSGSGGSGGGGAKNAFTGATRSGRGATFSTRPSPATRSSSGGGSGRGATSTPFRGGGRSGATGSGATATKRRMKFPGTGGGGGRGGGATGRNATKGGGGSATNRRHPATATGTRRYATPARATAIRAARALRRATAARVKRIRATSRYQTTRLPHAAREAVRRVRHLIDRLQQADTRLTTALATEVGTWWRNRRATNTTDTGSDTATDTTDTTDTAVTDTTDETNTTTEAARTATETTPPTARRHPTPPRRIRPMSANPLAAATAELNAAASGYAPDDMWTVAREIEQLPEIPANVALALRTYTMRLQSGEYPIEPPVGEALHQLYAGMAQLVSLAEEVVAVFRAVHAHDLARGEAPRTGEDKWDVGRR